MTSGLLNLLVDKALGGVAPPRAEGLALLAAKTAATSPSASVPNPRY